MAVGMAATVAYVSVSGLVKLFAGAGVVGLIFFTAIEAGKIVATSAIHTFNKKIGWVYNTILSVFIVIAMAITSLGIYGFLSSSYKETFAKLDGMNSQIALLETKKDGYNKQIELINKDRDAIRGQINDLNQALKDNKSQYVDKNTGNVVTYSDSRNRKAIMSQLTEVRGRETQLNTKSDSLTDLVFQIETQITETELGNDVAAELGPLKYLADVTGMTMDDVMKYFIILLMVIGDPMAVVMVVVYNKIAHQTPEEKEEEERELIEKAKKLEIEKVMKKAAEASKKRREESEEEEPTALANSQYREELTQDAIPADAINPEFWKSVEGLVPFKDENEKPGRPVNEMTEELVMKHLDDLSNAPTEEELIVEVQMEEVEEEEFVDQGETEEEVIEEVEENKVYVAPVIDEETGEIELPEQPIEMSQEVHLPSPVIEEEEPKKIRREDIKEIREKERGFSVPVPSRNKKTNTVDRIGSNKEIRDGKADRVYFKKRK